MMDDEAVRAIISHLCQQHDELRCDMRQGFQDVKGDIHRHVQHYDGRLIRLEESNDELTELKWKILGIVIGSSIAIEFIISLVKGVIK